MCQHIPELPPLPQGVPSSYRFIRHILKDFEYEGDVTIIRPHLGKRW